MPSKQPSSKKKPASRGAADPKSRELKSADLDKVTGGVTVGSHIPIGKGSSIVEDPCAGGR
ncbi:MAG TPA: hypothetical protein VMT54_00655 [Candidatus Cybelea sp.]|nr:hypothetical protein [Candidatus Cybelea sp.]